MPTNKNATPGPARLIAKACEEGKSSVRKLAKSAGIDKGTVVRAKLTNQWPKQARVRNGLRKALGLPEVAHAG